MKNEIPDDQERPTMEMESPGIQIDGGNEVEWVGRPTKNGKGFYVCREKIDEELKRIREILGDAKVLGVNHFPLTPIDKHKYPHERNEVSLDVIEESQKRVREMVRQRGEINESVKKKIINALKCK